MKKHNWKAHPLTNSYRCEDCECVITKIQLLHAMFEDELYTDCLDRLAEMMKEEK